jgi:hypothetical protein
MSIYVKIENLKYNYSDIYYKQLINIDMHQATIFNNNYLYYYKESTNIDFKLLGKFICYSKVSSGSRYHDVDFDVFEFENDTIFTNKINNIYCKGIPHTELDTKMIKLSHQLTYNDRPIYYYDETYNDRPIYYYDETT